MTTDDGSSLDAFGRGVKDRQGFGVTETTFETATEPFAPRATATASTFARLAKRAGSRKARYGAESSIATRCQVPPLRRVANVTDTGAPGALAARRYRDVSGSGSPASTGLVAGAAGSEALGTAATAETAGIVRASDPEAVPEPKATLQVAPGVAVATVTCAAVGPLLKPTTTSLPVARSIRETTSTPFFA